MSAFGEVAALLAAHKPQQYDAGNGYSEPREAWWECTCGAHIWEWQQFYHERHDDPEERFGEHLTYVIAQWAERWRDGRTEPERCPSCGCEPEYPTAVHILDCGQGNERDSDESA